MSSNPSKSKTTYPNIFGIKQEPELLNVLGVIRIKTSINSKTMDYLATVNPPSVNHGVKIKRPMCRIVVNGVAPGIRAIISGNFPLNIPSWATM